MKWIVNFLFLILVHSLSAQRLYLKIEAPNKQQDSIISLYHTNKSFLDIVSLEKYNISFIENLQLEGYFNLRAADLYKINDSVFGYSLNLREKYNFIYIRNYSKFSKISKLSDSIVPTTSFTSLINDVLNEYSKQGKPFNSLKLEDITFGNSDTIIASLFIKEFKSRKLDEILIKGYNKFPEAFIKNYADISIGDIFDRSKLIEKSEKLMNLPFVSQTKTPQVQFTQDSTKLFIYLEKQQANTFDGFIGFNNSEENDFQITGNIDLNLVNNFHTGEVIHLNYRNDGNAQEWFDFGVRFPYILKTKFSVEGGLRFFNQDSTFSNSSQEVKIDYQIKQNFNIGLNSRFENSSSLLDEFADRQDIQDYTKNRFGLSFVYDKPRMYSRLFLSNQYINLLVGFSERITSVNKKNQEFLEIHGRQIFKLNKRQYIYLGLNAGYLYSDHYLSNELYRFGGINSMRGFTENRFFANIYGALQTEYRYVLGSNLYIHSVLDYGFYENDINRFSENLYSFGVGFGLETKAGVLRLIFANGGSDSQSLEFNNSQIHLNFLSVF